MQFRALAITVLIALMGPLGHCDEPKKPDVNDWTKGLIYEKLADFVTASQVLNDEPFCCLVTGERLDITRGDEVIESGIYRICARDGTKSYDASARVDSHSTSRPVEFWSQRILEQGKIRYRSGTASRTPRVRMMDENTPEEERFEVKVKPLDPIADMVAIVGSLDDWRSDPTRVEKVFLHNATLETAKFDEEGNIVSRWAWNSPDVQCVIEVLWKKKFSYMPSETKYYLVRGDVLKLFSDARCKYVKRGAHWLPDEYSGVNFRLSAGESHFDLRFEWRLQGELKKDFIDPDATDWRQPIQEMFQAEWQQPSRLLLEKR